MQTGGSTVLAGGTLADRLRGGRLDPRVANRKMLESLIKAGAFDFTKCDRAELFDCIEEALASAAETNRDTVPPVDDINEQCELDLFLVGEVSF